MRAEPVTELEPRCERRRRIREHQRRSANKDGRRSHMRSPYWTMWEAAAQLQVQLAEERKPKRGRVLSRLRDPFGRKKDGWTKARGGLFVPRRGDQ